MSIYMAYRHPHTTSNKKDNQPLETTQFTTTTTVCPTDSRPETTIKGVERGSALLMKTKATSRF